MDEYFLKQLFAELIDAQEQAFAVFANAVGDVTDRTALAAALQRRLATAQAAASHPMRDGLLTTALRALQTGSKP
jgi:hypothetical protein